jgi:hypothetical protein
MEWNDVIYSYDGEHLTGKVNGLEKRVSVTGIIIILIMYALYLIRFNLIFTKYIRNITYQS